MITHFHLVLFELWHGIDSIVEGFSGTRCRKEQIVIREMARHLILIHNLLQWKRLKIVSNRANGILIVIVSNITKVTAGVAWIVRTQIALCIMEDSPSVGKE